MAVVVVIVTVVAVIATVLAAYALGRMRELAEHVEQLEHTIEAERQLRHLAEHEGLPPTKVPSQRRRRHLRPVNAVALFALPFSWLNKQMNARPAAFGATAAGLAGAVVIAAVLILMDGDEPDRRATPPPLPSPTREIPHSTTEPPRTDEPEAAAGDRRDGRRAARAQPGPDDQLGEDAPLTEEPDQVSDDRRAEGGPRGGGGQGDDQEQPPPADDDGCTITLSPGVTQADVEIDVSGVERVRVCIR